jgi:hypothetical protein
MDSSDILRHKIILTEKNGLVKGLRDGGRLRNFTLDYARFFCYTQCNADGKCRAVGNLAALTAKKVWSPGAFSGSRYAGSCSGG